MAETRSSSPPALRSTDRYKPRCVYCSRKFNHYNDLYTHTLEDHHIRLSASHVCWRCDQVCKSEAGLWRHMAFAHYKLSRKRTMHHSLQRMERDSGSQEEEPAMAKSRRVEVASTLIDLSDCMSELKRECTKTEVETLAACPVCHLGLRREEGLRHISTHQKEVVEAFGRMRNYGAKLAVMKLVWEMQGLDG